MFMYIYIVIATVPSHAIIERKEREAAFKKRGTQNYLTLLTLL